MLQIGKLSLAFLKPEMVNTRVHHLTRSHIRRILSAPRVVSERSGKSGETKQ